MCVCVCQCRGGGGGVPSQAPMGRGCPRLPGRPAGGRLAIQAQEALSEPRRRRRLGAAAAMAFTVALSASLSGWAAVGHWHTGRPMAGCEWDRGQPRALQPVTASGMGPGPRLRLLTATP